MYRVALSRLGDTGTTVRVTPPSPGGSTVTIRINRPSSSTRTSNGSAPNPWPTVENARSIADPAAAGRSAVKSNTSRSRAGSRAPTPTVKTVGPADGAGTPAPVSAPSDTRTMAAIRLSA